MGLGKRDPGQEGCDLILAQITLVTHLPWDLEPLLRQPVTWFPICQMQMVMILLCHRLRQGV